MAGPTPTRTSVRSPKLSAGQAPIAYNNKIAPTLSATTDTALLLIERIEKRIEKIENQLASHHDELVAFKASFSTLKKVAVLVGVLLGLWLAYLSLEASRKGSPSSVSSQPEPESKPHEIAAKSQETAHAKDDLGSAPIKK